MRFIICAFLFLMAIGIVCRSEWECEFGVPYKENECNECNCTENRLLKCKDQAGCMDLLESKLYNCVVGTDSQRNCNKCHCLKDLGTVCTNYECD